ncbi:MAG: cytochrome c family protein [Pseudomonadota bacterium]
MNIKVFCISVALLLLCFFTENKAFAADALYSGIDSCKPCHEKEYNAFIKHARKRNSFESVEKMKKGLTPQEVKGCYECHTTGYGRPSGFVSESETPQLKIAGCEVCHGPGSIHIETQQKADIRTNLTEKDCESCHNAERVRAFNYRPLIYGGGH